MGGDKPKGTQNASKSKSSSPAKTEKPALELIPERATEYKDEVRADDNEQETGDFVTYDPDENNPAIKT